MAVKLGSGDALLYWGETVADRAYLGAVQVPRVLYFDGAVDYDWEELGNWWFDDAHTVAATSLPAGADSAVISGLLFASAGVRSITNITFDYPDELSAGTLTVTGLATFLQGSLSSAATIVGNATFNSGSNNAGTVTGNATFNDSSYNSGTVTGTATFTGSACNDGGTAGTSVPDPPPSCS